MTTEQVVVIGGGQAGLAAARCLQRRGADPLVLDASDRIGDAWRRRYDSLVLFTPAQYDSLPDLPFPAPRNTYPSKDQVADYLELYADHHQLRVRSASHVTRLRQQDDGLFRVDLGAESLPAGSVVIATGALQQPSLPPFATKLPVEIKQLHSSQYHNPGDVNGTSVLVVGAGNSGAQIAEELADRFDVCISFERLPKRLPQRVAGKDIFWWLQRAGVLDRTSDTAGSAETVVGAIPLIGSQLPRLLRDGKLRRVPRVIGASHDGVRTADGASINPSTIIWATGYRNDFSWVDIPHAINTQGQPLQRRGISTNDPRLGFIGLPGLHTKGSAFLGFVGRDADHLATSLRT